MTEKQKKKESIFIRIFTGAFMLVAIFTCLLVIVGAGSFFYTAANSTFSLINPKPTQAIKIRPTGKVIEDVWITPEEPENLEECLEAYKSAHNEYRKVIKEASSNLDNVSEGDEYEYLVDAIEEAKTTLDVADNTPLCD